MGILIHLSTLTAISVSKFLNISMFPHKRSLY